MDDEKLIALVQTKNELFNKSSPYYKLQSRKYALWKEIGRELNASGQMCRRRWLTLRCRYGREVRKANAPSGSGMEFKSQWHLLEAMKFLKTHIVPRPVRCSQIICETAVGDQGELQSPAEETQLQTQGHAHESEVPSPLWPLSPLSPITISLPSPSPPFPVAQSVVEKRSTQVATKKGRKRGSSVSSTSEVEQKMIEAIELYKNRWSSTQPTQQTEQQQSANPAVQSFCNLMVSILNKMDEEKQARAIEKMLQTAFEVQRES
ncbi:transcription factor Adf-1-like [Bactrocera dorsalis]|uniref:Transcription factor Adf-1-like n=1 Tax=Bactrocera dorsalis TaxID=27457 RepID=A0ABM3JX84_BACDO|nr:transcription factor Adf-1-like [Bactrocera dorsalis]